MTEKPTQIPEPNFDALVEVCQKYIDEMFTDGSSVLSDYIFNAAIKAVFGETIEMWIGDRVLEREWAGIKDVPVKLSWLQGLDEGEKDKLITPAEFLKHRKN